jgi:phosphatidylglycerophosphate synthase
MAVAPQHWLSIARLVVGVVTWLLMPRANQSAAILPLVLLACVFDFADGRVARARGTEGPAGRVLDNLCDFAFLAMFFHAAAAIALWSEPVDGVSVRWWRRANELPLLALALSFGSYALRAAFSAVRAVPLAPSPIGRAAGVLNYVLALLGAVAVSLHWGRPSLLVEGAMVVVTAVNVAACAQNWLLLVRPPAGERA